MSRALAQDGGGDGGSEISLFIGSLLPNQIGGVTEILPLFGGRYGFRTGSFGVIELGVANAHAEGVDFTTFSGTLRADLPAIDQFFGMVYGGLDVNSYRPLGAQDRTSETGLHVGSGLMMHVSDTMWLRTDLKFAVNPGTSLAISLRICIPNKLTSCFTRVAKGLQSRDGIKPPIGGPNQLIEGEIMLKSLCLRFALGLVTMVATVAHAQTNAPNQPPSPAAIPDTQIAKILLTINDGEIDAGKMAKSHAQSREVKDFAGMMVDEHQKNMKETKEIAKKNKINPEDSDTAKALKEDAKTANKDLKRQDKAAFDRAYIKQQVMMHEKALATLKDKLIPDAQNPDFKAHLEKTQAAVAAHLEHAKTLETKLQ